MPLVPATLGNAATHIVMIIIVNQYPALDFDIAEHIVPGLLHRVHKCSERSHDRINATFSGVAFVVPFANRGQVFLLHSLTSKRTSNECEKVLEGLAAGKASLARGFVHVTENVFAAVEEELFLRQGRIACHRIDRVSRNYSKDSCCRNGIKKPAP